MKTHKINFKLLASAEVNGESIDKVLNLTTFDVIDHETIKKSIAKKEVCESIMTFLRSAVNSEPVRKKLIGDIVDSIYGERDLDFEAKLLVEKIRKQLPGDFDSGMYDHPDFERQKFFFKDLLSKGIEVHTVNKPTFTYKDKVLELRSITFGNDNLPIIDDGTSAFFIWNWFTIPVARTSGQGFSPIDLNTCDRQNLMRCAQI